MGNSRFTCDAARGCGWKGPENEDRSHRKGVLIEAVSLLGGGVHSGGPTQKYPPYEKGWANFPWFPFRGSTVDGLSRKSFGMKEGTAITGTMTLTAEEHKLSSEEC